MSKPYFLLVTGSFAPAHFYNDLVEQVKAWGYDIKAIHLATVGLGPGQGRDTPPATMYDDAALIAKEAEALADAGREVIVVGHSYGGMPATESIKGLSVSERQKAGKKGGIVRLAYKTAAVTTPGHSAAEGLPAPPADDPPRLVPDEKGYLHFADMEYSASLCFSDLPKEEQLQWQSRFALHSAVSFTNPLTYAGYKDVPVSYLLCEDDLVIPADWQRKEIEMIEAETGRKVDITSIKSGHCPTVKHLDEVVDWFVHLAAQ